MMLLLLMWASLLLKMPPHTAGAPHRQVYTHRHYHHYHHWLYAPSDPQSVSIDPVHFPLSPGYHLFKTEAHLDSKTIPLAFGVFLPRMYFETHKPMPVVVTLHTRGAEGADGRSRYINEELAMLSTTNRQDPRTAGQYTKTRLDLHTQAKFITLMPQCPTNYAWEIPPIGRIVKDEVHMVLKAYHADANRVYLTGFSYGGSSTWTVALQDPKLFAAIAPIESRATPHPDRDVKVLANVPIYLSVGADDHVFLKACNVMKDALGTIHHADFVYRIVPDGNHFCYPCVYEDPKFWTWLLSHRRGRPTTEPAFAAIH